MIAYALPPYIAYRPGEIVAGKAPGWFGIVDHFNAGLLSLNPSTNEFEYKPTGTVAADWESATPTKVDQSLKTYQLFYCSYDPSGKVAVGIVYVQEQPGPAV